MKKAARPLTVLALTWLTGCTSLGPAPPADLLVINGRVYTFSWDEPSADGTPAPNAPHSENGWRPDAEALAIRDGRIVFAGSTQGAMAHRGEKTRVLDVQDATVLPGLVDSHTHVARLGERVRRVNLLGVETEAQAVDRVVEYASHVPKGDWIVGWGWDEGAWANRYPTMKLLSERVPDHPVFLASLHSFAGWGNRLAFERAGITSVTKPPAGGDIVKDSSGNPAGIVLNRAVPLLSDAVPKPTDDELQGFFLAGLQVMARDGYVAVHEAGLGEREMKALAALDAAGRLPIRLYAMLSAREASLCRDWAARGPDKEGMLTVRAVKAFYDGALGSRGARLLDDYSDRPGHRGVSDYGFDRALVTDMMKAGFQVAVHAIGDAGNRETLDFFESVISGEKAARDGRHRIEHAQVVHPDDIPRFAKLGILASMQPPHAVEDKTWAEARLGPERIKGAYAWRSLRRAGARLVFNSDLAGSDHDIFYGLHAAMTRRDKNLEPEGGWYRGESVTPEEAVRGYTTWAAYAGFAENETGILAPGRWADVTIMNVDPLVLGAADPAKLLQGSIRATIVRGEVLYDAAAQGTTRPSP